MEFAAQDSVGPRPARIAGGLAYHGDIGLIAGIRRGEHAALADVYRRYGGRLHDLASRVCGPKYADGVVEQVLLELWRDPARFDAGRSTLQNFLVWQTHARAIRVVRSGRPRPGRSSASRNQPMRASRDLGAWLPARVGAPAWRRLSALPAHERDAIALVYFCGHGPDELVGVLEQSPEIWARRIRAGLSRLARQSRGDEPWPP